jgi:hypothetical protein
MTDEEFDRYATGRYRDLVSFYDRRAQRNKFWHRMCSVFVIVVSGFLAPAIATGMLSSHRTAGGFLSASVVIVTAISSHFQFNQNWLRYRRTWDALEREVSFRNAGVNEYRTTADRNGLFVERVEALASDEGNEWFERHIRTQERFEAISSDSTGGAITPESRSRKGK